MEIESVYVMIRKIIYSEKTAAHQIMIDLNKSYGWQFEDVIQDIVLKWIENPKKDIKYHFSYLCSYCKNYLLDLKKKSGRGAKVLDIDPETLSFDENNEFFENEYQYKHVMEIIKNTLNAEDIAVLSQQMSRTEAAFKQNKSYEAYVKALQRKTKNIKEIVNNVH